MIQKRRLTMVFSEKTQKMIDETKKMGDRLLETIELNRRNVGKSCMGKMKKKKCVMHDVEVCGCDICSAVRKKSCGEVVVGKFRIRRVSDLKVNISLVGSLEGGEFSMEKFEKCVGEFYDENF